MKNGGAGSGVAAAFLKFLSDRTVIGGDWNDLLIEWLER